MGPRPREKIMEGTDVSDLFRALIHVGTVEAVRQQYHIYRSATGDFVVLSPSTRGTSSYHLTQVPAGKVGALEKMVGRSGATTGSLMKESKLDEAFGTKENVAKRFDILMGLYVLTALGKLEMGKSGRNLVFTKKPEA
jgi:hypothetical protein